MVRETVNLSEWMQMIYSAVTVDKSKLLDKIGTANIREDKAGSSTQHISATYFKR